jgi:hypothetical protein
MATLKRDIKANFLQRVAMLYFPSSYPPFIFELLPFCRTLASNAMPCLC